MTSTERVMAAVRFEKPDRLPVWDNYWQGFVENWRRYKKLGEDANPTDYYGIDVAVCGGDEAFFPSQRRLIRDEGDHEVSQDGWGRTVRTARNNVHVPQTIETLLDDPSNLAQLDFEPAELESRYLGLSGQAARERAAGRCVFAKVGGIYVRSHFIRGEDRLLVDMALDEGFCNELFDRVVEHLTSVAMETLKRANAWETGLWVYDDVANCVSTMFSPSMFEKYLLPRYRSLISRCRAAGCKHIFLHSDGNIEPVLDLLLEAGFEGFNPLEPRCGLNLPRLREKCGRRVVFFGGICNTRILPRGDKAEIETHVRPLVEMGRDGGLILGQASVGDDISPETYDSYMSLLGRS